MNLEQSIKTNVAIAKLIKTKHDSDGFPGTFAKRGAIEAKYYLALLGDIDRARSALGNDGLAEIIDDFDYALRPTKAIEHGQLDDGKGKRKAKKEPKKAVEPGDIGSDQVNEQ
jgi:hypothetical protein